MGKGDCFGQEKRFVGGGVLVGWGEKAVGEELDL